MPQYKDLLSQLIESYVKDSDIVVELGCGKGALKQCHPKYIGVDISYVALKKYLDGKMRIQADIERIPVKSSFASLVFSIATLEHVPSPENCLTEIDRILRPGGIAVLAPAWFCRPWAAKGLPVKKYSELGVLYKIRKFLIPLRNHIVWRGFSVIPKRIFREILYALFPRPLPFRYKQLSPNLEEYVYTDCDAFVSMDPHEMIMYFRSRGYEILNGGDRFLRRIFYRHEPVIVRKKKI